jgi:hypothetical protein
MALHRNSDHIAELAELLATGLLRVLARKSSGYSPDAGESSLHLPPDRSGHPTPLDRRIADG